MQIENHIKIKKLSKAQNQEQLEKGKAVVLEFNVQKFDPNDTIQLK